MAMKRCQACGCQFTPWPQSKNQQYCSNPNCQRERRRRNQAEKRARSSSRRASDALYFKDWAAKHPDYWKNYRSAHPEYVVRNRDQQRQRNRSRIAKDYASDCHTLPPGLYQLIPLLPNGFANEAPWIVQITVLSKPVSDGGGNCKMKT